MSEITVNIGMELANRIRSFLIDSGPQHYFVENMLKEIDKAIEEGKESRRRIEEWAATKIPSIPIPDSPLSYIVFPLGSAQELRDWFAGQAMMGLIQGCIDLQDDESSKIRAEEMARLSYHHADAMLAEKDGTALRR
jgi:hypothetical protein